MKFDNKSSTIKIAKIAFTGLMLASFMVFMIIKNYTELRDALIANEQRHLLTIAETAARNVENHFKGEKRNLILLSKDSGFLNDFQNLKAGNSSYTGDAIRFYYRAGSPLVSSMQLLDENGNLLSQFPSRKKTDRDSSIKESEDIKILIKRKEFQISKVYFEDREPYIYLLQPIKEDGVLEGIIRAKISIRSIYSGYIRQIKSGEKGYASIKTSDGIFLMHPKENQIGYKAIDLRREILPDYNWKELEELFKDQESGNKGTRIYHSVWVLDEKPKLVKKFNAFAPINIGDQFWIMTIATDYEEVVERIRGSYYSTIVISALIVLSFIFVGIYIFIIKEKKKKLKLETTHLEKLKQLNTELEKDIEKRKVLEKKLLKTMEENKKKELIMIHQSRHAAMGEMIGNIAHQWRQPLSSLSLLISNIEDIILYGEDDKEYIGDVFKRSRVIINKMSETIDDFRHFFRPKAKRERFTMERLVSLTISICGERLRHNEVKLETYLDEDLEMVGYFNQLCQVVLNIINNAVDALIENREKERLITLSVKVSKEKKLIILVEDNGGGIPEEILENIFDPYFSTKDEKNGTGLGLHMSKMIIEKNFGGSIEAKNSSKGAIFKIEIPMEEER